MDKIFTVIICCYNSEFKIERVLNNLFECTDISLYVDKVLVVDNASTDNTSIVVSNFMKNEPLVHLCYEKQQGLSNARKCGVRNSNTPWIIFLDDDNYVDKNWIFAMYRYVKENDNVGALNSIVIPRIQDSLTAEESKYLRASLKVLACTHADRVAAFKSKRSPFRLPIGAGLVIKTKPLKKLLEEGWLKLPGRTASNLTSGEDSEMARYILKCGYKIGFCSETAIEHEIGKKRLEKQYLDELWYQIGRGVAVVSQTYSRLFSGIYYLLLFAKLFFYFFIDRTKYNFHRLYIKGYCDEKNGK